MKGYIEKQQKGPVKRYCRTLKLKDDPKLIKEYISRHSESRHWPEIREGIRSTGILEMEMYIHEDTVFMIVETPVDFDWDAAMKKLATLPRQQEWETYMSIFQQCKATDTAEDKWAMMPRIFHLYD